MADKKKVVKEPSPSNLQKMMNEYKKGYKLKLQKEYGVSGGNEMFRRMEERGMFAKGGMVKAKKMRGGGMMKTAAKKKMMRGGAVAKKKMMRGGMAAKKRGK